jgi:hypothetical protein
MAIPGSASHRVVYATYLDAAGNPAEGFVTFEPRFVLTDAADATFVTTDPVRGDLDPTGYMHVDLMCTDDTDLAPPGWTWRVREHITGGRDFDIFVPYGDGSPFPLTGFAIGSPPSGSFAIAYIPWSAAGVANGVTPLGPDAKVPVGFLPDSNAVVVFSPTAPSSPAANQLWWNTTTQTLSRWDFSLSTWVEVVSHTADEKYEFTIAGTISTSAVPIRYYVDYDLTITQMRIGVTEAPTGTTGVTVDLKVDGTSVFAVAGDRPTIAPGEYTTVAFPTNVPATILAGHWMQIEITSVGDTTPGAGLVAVVRTVRNS